MVGGVGSSAGVAAGWISVFAFSVVAAHVAALLLMRPDRSASSGARPRVRHRLVLPQVVLVATGDNGQLDWIPSPTPYHVAVGVWDWASRNPIAVLALAIGVVQLCREAVPRAARWKAALVVVWLVAPLVATLLASIAQPSFEARYILAAAAGDGPRDRRGLVSLPRRLASRPRRAASCSAQAVRLGQLLRRTGRAARPLASSRRAAPRTAPAPTYPASSDLPSLGRSGAGR